MRRGCAIVWAMSKAFLRESDFPEVPDLPQPVSPLPPGAKNYLTAGGAGQLRAEMARLTEQRPALAAKPEDVDAKYALQRLDQRLRYLQQSLHSAEIVNPPPPPHEQVRFGSTVTVKDSRGQSSCYRIVGVDETDLDRNWVSWLSPIARALMNARLGQKVPFKFPSGKTELEISEITYE